ncbi:hypothetical protein QYF61_013931 [Mycteria americana]|uniref:Uncharacterized protein n=1 Tax=Mycteria americana TaxID=33587 RepID=A0AAN7NA20_MYCAM|nr:hypothetical protein QYF61_013931 [Mycteria americana]
MWRRRRRRRGGGNNEQQEVRARGGKGGCWRPEDAPSGEREGGKRRQSREEEEEEGVERGGKRKQEEKDDEEDKARRGGEGGGGRGKRMVGQQEATRGGREGGGKKRQEEATVREGSVRGGRGKGRGGEEKGEEVEEEEKEEEEKERRRRRRRHFKTLRHNLRPFPLLLSLVTWEKRMRPTSLQPAFRLRNPSSLSRSSSRLCSRSFTSFVALLWTCSSTSMSFLYTTPPGIPSSAPSPSWVIGSLWSFPLTCLSASLGDKGISAAAYKSQTFFSVFLRTAEFNLCVVICFDCCRAICNHSHYSVLTNSWLCSMHMFSCWGMASLAMLSPTILYAIRPWSPM